MIPWAYGLRSPNGLNFSPDGRLYFTDNQGEWIPACKLQEIRQGEFYGHMASVRWWPGKKDGDRPPMTPPAIWFPYFSMCRSSSQPVWDTTGGKFGPFAGECFIGELTQLLVMRANLEEVKGRMQGCVFLFRSGFRSGPNRLAFAPDGSLMVAETNRGWGSVGGQSFALERVVYTGKLPFEMHSMTITPTGWDVHFTKPVDTPSWPPSRPPGFSNPTPITSGRLMARRRSTAGKTRSRRSKSPPIARRSASPFHSARRSMSSICKSKA